MTHPKTLFRPLILLVLMLLAMSPAAAQTSPPESLTEWASTPGLDETAPPVTPVLTPTLEATGGLPEATTAYGIALLNDVYTRLLDNLDRQSFVMYLFLAGGVLAVILVVYQLRDRLPKSLFDVSQKTSQDAIAGLIRSTEARIEAAKHTPSPIDDAAYQMIAALLSEVGRLVAPSVAAAMTAQSPASAPDVNQFTSVLGAMPTVEQMAQQRAAERYGSGLPTPNDDGTYG